MRAKLTVLMVLALVGAVRCATPAVGADKPEALTVPTAEALRDATWTLVYRWEGSSEGRTQITFKSDGTFVTSGGLNGRWFQIGRNLVFAFSGSGSLPAWSSVYSSTLNGNGTAFSGIQGWVHTSGKPKGTHVGFRSREFIADANKLEKSSGPPVTGEGAGHKDK